MGSVDGLACGLRVMLADLADYFSGDGATYNQSATLI
jgi:hypothetical protein